MAMIRQIQARYDAEQDRILLRVSRDDDKEFRIWLTRRFLSLILKALNQHLEIDPDISSQTSPSSKEEVKAFKREQALEQADFQQQLFAYFGKAMNPSNAFNADKNWVFPVT